MFPARLAANVAWLFTEHAWPDRFGAARDAGFAAVEFPWPEDPVATAREVDAADMQVAMVNMPAGNLAAGDRGWTNDPARVEEWRGAFADALRLAIDLGCPTVNVLAGNAVHGVPECDQLACLEENLRWALPIAADAGITVVTELLNRQENPSYALETLDDAEPLLDRLAPLGWRLQLDTYHLGLTEADVAAALRRAGDLIGHVQLADVPGRHEPGSGALDWGAIGAALGATGYGGPVGLEYRPSAGTLASLRELPGWIGPLGELA